MNKLNDPLQVVADLEPAMLSQLAEDSYLRRRQDDLARVSATGAGRARPARLWTVPRSRHRRNWTLLAGGTAITAAAAVAAAVAVSGAPGTGQRPSPNAAPHLGHSAQRFLLTSAETALHGSAGTGTYWYVRERDYEPSGVFGKHSKSGPAAKDQFGAYYAETEESWAGANRTRTIVNEDLRFTFASAADEAKWRAAGSPRLASAAARDTPVTSNYDMGFHWDVGNSQLTMAGLRKLPTTASQLGAMLSQGWKSSHGRSGYTSYAQYLVGTASSILSGPATPGTKAAMYRLLAEQPGITIVKSVTTPLGQTGVAIGNGTGDYLVIDPGTAQLLAYTTYQVRSGAKIPPIGGGTEVYEATGWTSSLP